MNGRKRHELKWQLLRLFFRSRRAFLEIFERYEERVLSFCELMKTHRSRLKLDADDLLSLVDFKSLETLRDREILTLKETAHELFRKPDETDRLDHYISTIYHELSILKEEHYTLKEEFLHYEQSEYDRFFREVSEFYPKRLRHIKNLYGKALRRLEDLLPAMCREKIVVRSLYLFGEELLRDGYRGGLARLYRKMYPEFGEAEGWAAAGASFLDAGFRERAAEAYVMAEGALSRKRKGRNSPRFRALSAEVREKVEELGAPREEQVRI